MHKVPVTAGPQVHDFPRVPTISPQGPTSPLVHSYYRISHAAEYRQLRYHPKYQKIWEESYCNELGRLFQGIGTGDKGLKKQWVTGTETFKVIKYEDVSANRRIEITYTELVCEVLPQKDDPKRTQITIRGNRIIYPREIATPTASL